MTSRKVSSVPDPGYNEQNNAPKTKTELREEGLDGFLQLAQFGCLAFGQFADAGAIGMHGKPLTRELVNLCEQNSKIASKVDLLIEVGPYAALISAAIPFVAQILVNHGIFKAEQFANAGVVHPEELEARMKAQLMQQAIDSMREQQRLEEEMRQMTEEMQASMNDEKNDE